MRRYSGSTGRSAQGGSCFVGGFISRDSAIGGMELWIRRDFERSLRMLLVGWNFWGGVPIRRENFGVHWLSYLTYSPTSAKISFGSSTATVFSYSWLTNERQNTHRQTIWRLSSALAGEVRRVPSRSPPQC